MRSDLLARHWAMNNGISFHTPEEFFLQQEPREMKHKFDPSGYIADTAGSTDDTCKPSPGLSEGTLTCST